MKARIGAAVLAVVIAALWVSSLREGLGRIAASRVLLTVEARTAAAIRMGEKGPPVLIQNVAALRQVSALDPADVGLTVALASQYLLLQRWDSAIATYTAALAREPRPEIYLNRGRALLGAGRPQEAYADFETAVMLAPFLSKAVPPTHHAQVVARVKAKTGWNLQ
jgi:tetratricopeptide (TPR) repeat protein